MMAWCKTRKLRSFLIPSHYLSSYNVSMIRLTPKKTRGTITVPASKSQTIRAFLIAAFSREKSVIRHPLLSADTISAINAIRTLGAIVDISEDKETAFVDASAVSATDPVTIDAGNSGTTEYLLLPMAASLGVDVTITGDAQLRSRPVGPLAGALRDLGVDVKESSGKPPVTVRGPMKGGSTIIECRSSQYLSGLLLGAAMADGASKIDCSLLYEKPYVTLTLGWLRKQGIEFSISDDYEHAYVRGGQRYHGFDEYIAGDWSSASFFLAMAAMSGTSITVKGLDRDDPQGDKAILDVLEAMGASVSWNGNDVTVTGPDTLCGGDFDLNAIPDTLPILAVTAAAAEGTTRLGNVPQARIKETDRISCMRENLETLGVRCEEEEDGLVIHGTGKVGGGAVKGFGDHRIIMAMASLSSAADGAITIDDEKAAEVTFPGFFSLLEEIRNENI